MGKYVKTMLKRKWLVALMIMSVLGVFSGSMISPIEIKFLNQITHKPSLSSFAFTFGALAAMLGALWFSSMANYTERKKVILVGLILTTVLPLVYANVYTVMQIYGAKFVWVFAVAGVGTITGAFIQQEVSDFKSSVGLFFGCFYAIQAGTGAIGSVIGGVISDRFGMSYVFYAVFIVYIIQLLVIVVAYSEAGKSIASKHKGVNAFGDAIRLIWYNRELRARFILVTVFGINWSTKVILYPLIIFSVTMSDSMTGTVLGTQGFVAMLCLPFVGKVIDKVGYSKVLWFGYAVLGAATLALSLTSTLWLIWLAVGFVALGEACNGPAMSTLEVRNIPDGLRNSVVALHSSYATFIEIFATSGVGVLLIFINPQEVLFVMAVLIMIALVSVFLFLEINRKKDIKI